MREWPALRDYASDLAWSFDPASGLQIDYPKLAASRKMAVKAAIEVQIIIIIDRNRWTFIVIGWVTDKVN